MITTKHTCLRFKDVLEATAIIAFRQTMTEHDARVISLHQLYLSPSCRLVKLLSSRGGQTALSRCIVNNIQVEVRTAGAVRPMSQIFALFFCAVSVRQGSRRVV